MGPAPITSRAVVFLCLGNHSMFAFRSPILLLVAFGFPIVERKQFVVTCKHCRREVPSGVKAFPFQSIVVLCPLCGELRRYLPSEVFLGVPNTLVRRQAPHGAAMRLYGSRAGAADPMGAALEMEGRFLIGWSANRRRRQWRCITLLILANSYKSGLRG
jgi:hypothetical protein